MKLLVFLIFWVTVLITLGGCASIDTYGNLAQCLMQKQETADNRNACNEAVGSDSNACTAQFPDLGCDEQQEAVNKHDKAVDRREQKRADESFCSNQGLVRYCETRSIMRPEDCGCITRGELNSIFRW